MITKRQLRWANENMLYIAAGFLGGLYLLSLLKPVVYKPRVVGINWTDKKAHIKYKGKDFIFDFSNPSSELKLDQYIVYYDETVRSVDIKDSKGTLIKSNYKS